MYRRVLFCCNVQYLRSKTDVVKRLRGLHAILTHKLKLQEKTSGSGSFAAGGKQHKETHLRRCVEATTKIIAAIDGSAGAQGSKPGAAAAAAAGGQASKITFSAAEYDQEDQNDSANNSVNEGKHDL